MIPLRTVKVLLVAGALLAVAALLPAAASAASYGTFALTKPGNNQRVSGTTTVTTAISKRALKRVWGVEFWVDGQRVAVDRKAPFRARINTRRFDNGEHVLRASLVVKKKGSSGPNRQVCEYARSIYIRINNSLSRKPKAKTAAVKKKKAKKKTLLPTAIAGSKKKWSLIFRDDFNGNTLDRSKWSDQREDWIIGGNPYNDRENAWYLPQNTSVSGGTLRQRISQQPVGKYPISTSSINSNNRFSFRYGYIEARVKIPACLGCWPVFWTLPQGGYWPPELDIFEFMHVDGRIQPRPFFASHWSENGVNHSNLDYFTMPCGTATDYTRRYHTYGFLWTPKKIQPYLDGVPGPAFTGAAVPHVAMYLILSLSVADGNVPVGTPSMQTDYIRVWQEKR